MRKILSVTELTLAIKRELEPRFCAIEVEGEISNLKAQASGHFYFSLKDQGAQISAVLFKGNARNVARLPKAGDRVILRGELSLYAPRGNYQIIVRELEHAGVGELLMELHRLKEELKRRGWLSSEHKKPLPKYPKTIGVVTSPTGAVIQDIIHVLKRRYPTFHLILHPVRVQGKEAAGEIAAAIQTLNARGDIDVMIVGRGGGSLEDLWPFNEEVVASAIFHSKIPIISAVGHETDVTLADCVADVRAPTPTAAAEISVKELSSQLDFLTQSQRQIDQILKQKIAHLKQLTSGLARHPSLSSPYAILSEHYQRVDDFTSQIDGALKYRLEREKVRLSAAQKHLQSALPLARFNYMKEKCVYFSKEIHRALDVFLKGKKERLCHLKEMIDAACPQTILKKGYCIPFKEKSSSVILSAKEAFPGMGIRLRFHDGEINVHHEEQK
ncbi:MAG: exodeoxyribonuclease VII large subunit [Chlamydiia bacterium]|nr:exodeoxyribonuclease VII large subunit [Chlamydiia bacterium]